VVSVIRAARACRRTVRTRSAYAIGHEVFGASDENAASEYCKTVERGYAEAQYNLAGALSERAQHPPTTPWELK
jgi:hypothetical protein